MTLRRQDGNDRPPLILTKRLVVHRPRVVDLDLPVGRDHGPDNGDPVWLAAPCARLRAGYLCECGFGFEYADGRPEEAATTYREEEWVLSDRHGRVDEVEAAALAEQIERIPVGTIVERRGLGIAPLFEPIELRPGHDPWWTLDVSDPHRSQVEGS